MKRQDLSILLTVGVIAAILSFLIASFLFKTPSGRSSQIPVAPTIDSNFPDVYNDPAYSAFFNHHALDPSQPVKIGGSRNSNPFNSNGQ